MSDSDIELLGAMAMNETRIARLYELYAAKFSSHRQFWLGLAGDERRHASWLNEQATNEESKTAGLPTQRFTLTAVRTFSEYLENEISHVAAGNISLLEALSTTLYIEESLLENKYFEVIGPDSTGCRNTFTQLQEETKLHLIKAKEELSTYKKTNSEY